MHGLRAEYQDRINFVILDFSIDADLALARMLGVGKHPAYAVVQPDSAEVTSKLFGASPRAQLRDVLDQAIAAHGG